MVEAKMAASTASYAAKLAKIALPLGLIYYLLGGVMLGIGALAILLTQPLGTAGAAAYFAIALIGFLLYALIGLFAFLARKSMKFTLLFIIILINVVLSASAYIALASSGGAFGPSYAPPILLLVGIVLAAVAYFAFLRARAGISGVVGGALLMVAVILIWIGNFISPLAALASAAGGPLEGYYFGVPFGVDLFGASSVFVLVAGIILALFIIMDAFMPQKYRAQIFKTGIALAGMLFLVGVAISAVYLIIGGFNAIGGLGGVSGGLVPLDYAVAIVLLVAGIVGMIAAVLGAIGSGLYIPVAIAEAGTPAGKKQKGLK